MLLVSLSGFDPLRPKTESWPRKRRYKNRGCLLAMSRVQRFSEAQFAGEVRINETLSRYR
jgi:hypothetical protein